MEEDDNLETEEDFENMMIVLKINPDLSEEMQDMLHDQLTQCTKSFLLTFKWPLQGLESFRKAMVYGKKKTAQNAHRARNRVARPEIAETMGQLEERYRSWKKDFAYLKDRSYDFKDQWSRSSWTSCPMKCTKRSPFSTKRRVRRPAV